MTRLVLVRHGQTAFNREDRWQGSESDVPLDDEGRRQARAVAEALADRYAGEDDLAALYTSDLLRARQTAEILAGRLGLEPRPLPSLRELSHGRWEGLTKREVRERFPAEHAAYEADPLNVARPGGESYAQLGRRVWPALESLSERHPGERVVVVSHGGPIRLVLSRALDRPLTQREAFGVVNGSWFEVARVDAVWRIVDSL